MKKALILFLLFIPLFLEAQVRVFPADTVTKVNNGTGGGPLGRTGGVTFTFSMHTGVYDSCAYWGFVSGVNGDIKMAMNNLVAPPTPNCTYTGSEYFVLTGGLGTNSLTFSGSTNVYCQNTANNFSNTSVTTRAFVTVSAGTFIQVDSFLLVKVAGQNSFDVTVRYETYGPTGRNYFVNYANTWTPSVTLFDALHTDDNRSICTSFESDIYAYSEIKADTIIGAPDTVCSGNASGVLTASATGGSGTYSYQWYSNGAMVVGAVNSAYNTPTITANTDYFCVIYDSCSAFSGFVRADTTDTVTIVVSGVAAVGGTAASDQVLCPENTPNTLLATGYSNGTITKWQIATDNLFSVPIDIANITDSLTGLQIEAAAGGPLLQSYFARMEIDNPACPASYSSTVSITINDPSNLTFVDDTGTCYVNGNSGWQHFYHPQRRNIIASINSNSQDIGITEVIVFQHAGNSIRVNTPTRCLTWHAVMNRSFVIHSADTFSNPVNVRLYFTDAELAELIDTSLITQNTGGATTWPTNDPPGCTDNDDVRSINDVLVTQISNAVAENGAFDIHDGDFLLHTPANSGIGTVITCSLSYVSSK